MRYNTKKAILLVRVSTYAQDLEQQTIKVREAALKDGYLPENIIAIEETESGRKLKEDERLGLIRMKQCIENDSSIDCVYIYELSQLSRRANVSFSIREFLMERKIQLVCLTPPIRLLDDVSRELIEASNVMFGIFTTQAENEMAIKRARFKRGIERKKQLGKHHTGRVLFGYDTEKDGTYILHPLNYRIVEMCFEMYLSGKYSTRQLALELQKQGVFTDCSIFTARNNVQNILHNEEYTGINKKPQIISKEKFERVKYMMFKNRNSEYRVSHNAICKGLLVDKVKGYRLTLNAAGKSYFNTPRKCIWVSQSVVDDIVWNYAMDEHQRYHSMDREKLLEKTNQERIGWSKKANVASSKIRKCRERIDLIEERLIKGKISESKAEELEADIYNEIKLHENEYTHANNMANEMRFRIGQMAIQSNMTFDYDKMSLDEKCEIVKEVISVIYCWKPKRTELCLEIHNKLVGEIFTYHLNSYHKTIINVERKMIK
jgi:DNA invertase Pin-like site-specific DNA recombinase